MYTHPFPSELFPQSQISTNSINCSMFSYSQWSASSMLAALAFTSALQARGYEARPRKLWFPVVFFTDNRTKNGPCGPAAPNVFDICPRRPLKRTIDTAEIWICAMRFPPPLHRGSGLRTHKALPSANISAVSVLVHMRHDMFTPCSLLITFSCLHTPTSIKTHARRWPAVGSGEFTALSGRCVMCTMAREQCNQYTKPVPLRSYLRPWETKDTHTAAVVWVGVPRVFTEAIFFGRLCVCVVWDLPNSFSGVTMSWPCLVCEYRLPSRYLTRVCVSYLTQDFSQIFQVVWGNNCAIPSPY